MRPFLMLEDDAGTARGIRSLLLGCGWDVHQAATVPDALMMLDPAPEVALLDLMLPNGRSGEELIAPIRAVNPDCVVVVWTGLPKEDRRVVALKGRGIPVLIKPIRLTDLWDCLPASRA